VTAPLHRMPDSRVPLITAIVSGAAAAVMATLAMTLVATGF
jgi:hypothetical protein